MPKLANKKPVPVEQRIFSKNFKAARLAAGLTQQQVHAVTRIGQAHLSDVERQIANVGIDTMSKLSHAVKIPLYYLLQPDFERSYDFSNPAIWLNYAQHIEESDGISYERKVFIRNFIKARLASKLRKKDLTALADISNDFLIDFERGEVGISLNKAAKLAHVVAQPLYALLQS